MILATTDYIGMFAFLVFFLVGLLIIFSYIISNKDKAILYLGIGLSLYGFIGWILIFIRLSNPALAVYTMLLVRTSKILVYGIILYGFWRFRR